MSFNDYWKAKAAKRRKAWAAKAKHFAEKHMQLEDIRSKLFFSYVKREELLSLWNEHRTVQNPIARWDSNMHFSFSEQGLREAMQAAGADVSSLTMTIGKTNIVGQQPHEITHGDMLDLASNRRDLYEKYTNLETCTISYREVKMVIYRYTYQQQPFALYEFVPCLQLPISISRLEETSFSTLNIATLLMEIAAEYELRQEELNYHAKKLKLRTMKAIVAGDKIEFTLWDDKKLEQKVLEYVAKDYSLDKIINQVLRPWKAAVSKCFERATERALNEEVQKMADFRFSNQQDVNRFVEQILCPYLQEEGLHDVIVKSHGSKITLTYQGCQCSMREEYGNGIVFCPNTHYEEVSITLCASTTPMSIIGAYLKQMSVLNNRVDDCLVKIINLYHSQLLKNEVYSNAVQYLNMLIAEHAGKPVARLLKYIRWNIEPLLSRKFSSNLSIPSIKVTGDTSFSYIEKDAYMGWQTPVQDLLRERWVDAEGRTVYAADPTTTDVEAWKEEHKGLPIEEWSMPLEDFVEHYSAYSTAKISSSDFIEEKL